MDYRAIGSRCAFDFWVLSAEDRFFADRILEDKGFRRIDVDIIAEARNRIGRSRYVRGTYPEKAPEEVNCSSFMRWLYSMLGIGLPRLAVQQRGLGYPVETVDLSAGDLIFMTGWRNFYLEDPSDGVGHVGIVTGEQTVIHAKGRSSGVVEEPWEKFLEPGKFRGARRLVDQTHRVVTFLIPPTVFVESSDDIKWLVLVNLRRYRG